jgi:hypothetical protein
MLRPECGKLSSIFQKSYGGNLGDSATEARRATGDLARVMILAWLRRKNATSGMWETQFYLSEIV